MNMSYKKVKVSLVVAFVTLAFMPIIHGENCNSDNINDTQCYGFIINVTADQSYNMQTNICRLVNKLLHHNVSTYWISSDISILTQELNEETMVVERFFKKGSFVVSFSSDSSVNTKATALVYMEGIGEKLEVYKIMQPLENLMVYGLVEPRIAHYNGENADSDNYYNILKIAGFENQKRLKPNEVISNLTTDNYDIIIWGGGKKDAYYDTFKDILTPTGFAVSKIIREFVTNGGGYIGSCYGGWRAASGYRRPLGVPLDIRYSSLLTLFPIQLKLINFDVYRALPGGGVNVTVKIVNHDNPIAFGLPEYIDKNWYFGGPIFLERNSKHSNSGTLAVIKDANLENWYFDSWMELSPWWNCKIISNETKYKIAENWIKKSIGTPIWVTGKFGDGKVVAFGTHPEITRGMDSDWSCPPKIVYNTIWYTISNGPYSVNVNKSISFSKLNVDADGPYSGIVEEPIQFYGSVYDGMPPYDWYWDFQLSLTMYTSEEQNPVITFSYPGTYKVALIVTDAEGNIGGDVTTLEVYSFMTSLL